MANSNFSPELKKVLRQKTPSGKEIFELVKRYKKYRNGKRKEELREEILTINTKLVAYLAQKFAPTASVPVDDLFQAGMEGLIHALEKFSYRKGFRFSTYASFWIKRSMQMIREDDCAVSVSRYNRQTVSNLLKEGKGHIDFTDMTKEKSRALTILNAMNDKAYVYLDKPIETDTQAAAFKFEIKDPKDYEEGIFSTFANEDLEKALSKTLTDREKVVITKRYLEPIPMPYAEIVKEEVFGVKSADIARMSELRALRKLKHYFKSLKKKEFEDGEKRKEAKAELEEAKVSQVVRPQLKKTEEVRILTETSEQSIPRRLQVGTVCSTCEGDGRVTKIALDGQMTEEVCDICHGWGGKLTMESKDFNRFDKNNV